MTSRQRDRLAAHAARQLQEGDHRAGESDGADRDSERHFDQALPVDVTFGADVEGRGRIESTGRDQHGRHADQGVERRHQLRHRGHRNAARNHGADAAAEGNAADDKSPGDGISRRMRSQGGQRRDGHADHAELIAAPAGIRARQAAQCQDEQDAGDQIEQRDEVRAHGKAPSWPGIAVRRTACFRTPMSRPSTPLRHGVKEDVDARHKAGHDDDILRREERIVVVISSSSGTSPACAG